MAVAPFGRGEARQLQSDRQSARARLHADTSQSSADPSPSASEQPQHISCRRQHASVQEPSWGATEKSQSGPSGTHAPPHHPGPQ